MKGPPQQSVFDAQVEAIVMFCSHFLKSLSPVPSGLSFSLEKLLLIKWKFIRVPGQNRAALSRLSVQEEIWMRKFFKREIGGEFAIELLQYGVRQVLMLVYHYQPVSTRVHMFVANLNLFISTITFFLSIYLNKYIVKQITTISVPTLIPGTKCITCSSTLSR